MTKEFAIDHESRLLSNFWPVGVRLLRDNPEKKLPDVLTIRKHPPHFGLPVGRCGVHARPDRHEGDLPCKPNPSLITNGWDEDLTANTMQPMTDGKGTAFEIILKDTHTIGHDPMRFRKDRCCECISKIYGRASHIA